MTGDAQRRSEQLSASDERAAVTAALLESTANLVGQTDALSLIQRMCEGLVSATTHIRLAWAWLGHADTQEIRPLVAAGPAKAYADKLVIERNAMTSLGPAFRALQTQTPEVMTLSDFSAYAPWRAAGKIYGFQAAVACPLQVLHARERGILVFYADSATYIERIGLQPFVAFARLAEATLAQTEIRMQLHKKATHDVLTGLHNRAWLTEELEEMHANAQRYGRRYALMMFDLDGFKTINDRYGHAAGDRAIATVAEIANEETRRGDVIGRWGGDEFLALLPEADTVAGIAAAERIRSRLARTNMRSPEDGQIDLRAGFGVASYPDAATSVDDLLRAADAALYASKRRGGNRVSAAPMASS